LIYVEPTPYILGLVEIVSRAWPDGVDVLFMKENVSQSWGVSLDPRHMALLPARPMAALKAIRSRLASNDYTIVHLAGWAPSLMLASMLMARCRRIPVTVESDTPLPRGLPYWKRAVKRLSYPLLFRLPAMFLPGGKRQAAYLRHYGVIGDRITMAMMTVDVASISRYVDGIDSLQREKLRGELGLADAAIVFLYVGRMEPHKGVRELIEAFSRLPVGDGASPTLLLVGDGSMRTFVEGAAADSHIRFTGRLSGTALLDAYAAADVFVLASRFEPWGLVVNEAMAAGLPVIATDRVGCVDDLVIEGETGCVVSADSVDALAAAMQSLYFDRALCGKMARSSRALITGWTLQNEAEIVVNAWNRLVKP